MTKPPEEGTIWEWRAFGRVDEHLASKILSYPIRLGLSDLRGEDLYLVGPRNDQNIKLRRYSTGWTLKFKLLIEARPGAFELYNESAEFTYGFPVEAAILRDAARLLEVELAHEPAVPLLSDSKFVEALTHSSPPVKQTRVSKRRSQYQFEGGWLELAEVWFEARKTQSISIHSPDLATVKAMLEQLRPGNTLEAMSYIEACRRWG